MLEAYSSKMLVQLNYNVMANAQNVWAEQKNPYSLTADMRGSVAVQIRGWLIDDFV
jgi:hypothetical protein